MFYFKAYSHPKSLQKKITDFAIINSNVNEQKGIVNLRAYMSRYFDRICWFNQEPMNRPIDLDIVQSRYIAYLLCCLVGFFTFM